MRGAKNITILTTINKTYRENIGTGLTQFLSTMSPDKDTVSARYLRLPKIAQTTQTAILKKLIKSMITLLTWKSRLIGKA